MANFKNNRRYENLKRLSIEELETMLRTAPFLSDSQETSEYYDAIEEVILERETETPTGRLSDLDSSWEEFQQQYASPEGRGMRLYPEEERSEVSVLSTESNKPLARSLFRKVVPLAAVIAVVFMTMIAVQAAGVDVFGSLARWTEETFRFTGGDSTPAAETALPQRRRHGHKLRMKPILQSKQRLISWILISRLSRRGFPRDMNCRIPNCLIQI